MDSHKINFRKYFFKLYDAKIRRGEITFSQIGISKSVFNELCNNKQFYPTQELISQLEKGMKLSTEELQIMKSYLLEEDYNDKN